MITLAKRGLKSETAENTSFSHHFPSGWLEGPVLSPVNLPKVFDALTMLPPATGPGKRRRSTSSPIWQQTDTIERKAMWGDVGTQGISGDWVMRNNRRAAAMRRTHQ